MKYPRAFLLMFFIALAGCGGSGGGSDGQDYGLDARASASGLNVPTSPGGGGVLSAVKAFPNLPNIQGPTYLTSARDGTNRLFVTDRNGVIWVFANNPNVSVATVFLDLSSKVDDNSGEGGMLGLAFDPAFSSNGFFYVSYVTTGTRTVRVSRFKVTTIGGNVASASTEKVVFSYDHPNDYHFGGWIGFGPDGKFYLSAGDGGNEPLAQDTSTLFGKILRISINATAGTYTVPPDNPIPGNPMWALGFRNPWRCSFDRANGNLWCGDVGESTYEEVNRIERGGNYGWPNYEGPSAYFNAANRPYSDFKPAVFYYDHANIGVAVIGGYVYRGSALPSMVGRYLYSDFVSPKVWALQTDGSGNFVANTEVANNLGDARSFGEDDAGEVYAVVGNGTIYRFEASGSGTIAPMPATLSGTGLFTDTAALTPAPFLIDYAPNAPFWSDGAAKRRWFVLPDGQSIGFAADGTWSFPVGTITVKHFELPLAAGGTTRVETRVMVYRTDGWTGYTYRWRADQTDADLLNSSASATYQTINPATNAPTTLTWNFPSPAQCLQCHTQATGRVLGLNTRQFNGNHTYAATGRADNQLRTLNHIGIFSGDIGASSQYGAMPTPTDASASLEGRAKAYLDTNCSICHRPGGPTPVAMDLRYATALADMQLVGVANQGSVSGVRVVAGNHASSLLWQRATSTNGNVRMPPLGVQMVDEQGMQLLADWIDALR